MAKRKSYDDDFRASAVIMLEAQGYPTVKGALTAVANHLHVPARTLSRWFNKENNPPPDRLVKEKKGTLEEQLTNLLEQFIEEMIEARKGEALGSVAMAFGIAFDKLQMLKGQPTERHEHIDHSERVDRLAAIFDGARKRGGLPVTSASDGADTLH